MKKLIKHIPLELKLSSLAVFFFFFFFRLPFHSRFQYAVPRSRGFFFILLIKLILICSEVKGCHLGNFNVVPYLFYSKLTYL
jgi:hypothetical protein